MKEQVELRLKLVRVEIDNAKQCIRMLRGQTDSSIEHFKGFIRAKETERVFLSRLLRATEE